MIKLTRLEMPEALRTLAEERAARLRELIQNGLEPPQNLLDSYRDPALKAHLVAESFGKCAYCESKITHVYYGDVEHIKPKDQFPERRLDVTNLLLACAKCNGAKGNFWDDITPLLNPYEDDPDQEIFALGFMIARRPGHNRARLTIERLQLNRMELIERRKERIEGIEPLADQYANAPDGPLKDLLRRELCRLAVDRAEYALIVRTYLEAACDLQCNQLA